MHVYDFWGHGMLYTAISRVSSMQGMTVVGSSERKVGREGKCCRSYKAVTTLPLL